MGLSQRCCGSGASGTAPLLPADRGLRAMAVSLEHRERIRRRILSRCSKETAMARKPLSAGSRGAVPEAPDPQHRWDRPIQAPGHMQVDFEERVDFRRLQDYRLARVCSALPRSGLGPPPVFDPTNI